MKILWVSNAPWVSSGYGVQTKLFAGRIKSLGHEVALLAYYGLQGSILNLGGIPIYPCGHHPYGQDVMGASAQHFGADVIITHTDAWVIEPNNVPDGIKWVPWFPIDSEPCPPAVKNKIQWAWDRIVFSKFGKQEMDRLGINGHYIPCGVDAAVYHPEPMTEARARVGFPSDAFVVGVVAMNKDPLRKSFSQQVEAFSIFHKRHPDSLLYLHTADIGGTNLKALIGSFGLEIGKDVVFADQYGTVTGVDENYMRSMYSGLDVLSACSGGEGFGIPIVEAQACGCPVIVGDWTSMPELVRGGWKLPKKKALHAWTNFESFNYYPQPHSLAELYEEAYKRKGDQVLRAQAATVVQDYDANHITDTMWRPVLAEIEAGLK